MTLRSRIETLLQRLWWTQPPALAARLLAPLSWLAALLAGFARRRALARCSRLPVAVVVVGNLVVGGAGKTPAVIAIVEALAAAGRRPGVISRGYGRATAGVLAVEPGSAAAEVGDEPLLLRRRTGAAVWIGRDRVEAARALLAAHPEVDVVVADDGLQHHALARDVEVLVFDERGVGNGLRLPAGPLREPLPAATRPRQLVLYNAPQPSTPLPGELAQPRADRLRPLADWHVGISSRDEALAAWRGRAVVAVAAIAVPARVFATLERAGLRVARRPLPDHDAFAEMPWTDDVQAVIVTEKDAVKLDPASPRTRQVWVLRLDLVLPPTFVAALLARLPRADRHAAR